MVEIANPLHSTTKHAPRLRYTLHVPNKHFNELARVVLPQETFTKNENGKMKKLSTMNHTPLN
ncbi:hypothetical protein ACI2OX_11995 [Bacillus sp. N9]